MTQPPASPDVSVIITVKDGAATVGHAVASALAQAAVTEVVVVDDGSQDDTPQVVTRADDGSGRLKLIRLDQNQGPAHGRNLGIASSTASFICILDADDFMAPDRLERMFSISGDGWDMVADDIIFTEGVGDTDGYDRLFDEDVTLPRTITLSEMVLGNMPRKDRHRRELGFVKPIVRRQFLNDHSLSYDETLRLGEDVILYSRALLAGARFIAVEACGYFAVERSDSLSSSHSSDDLGRFANALMALEADVAAVGGPTGDVKTYRRNIQQRYALCKALDAKRADGWFGFVQACREAGQDGGFVVRELVLAKLATLARGR
ncbi:MAG: glycosyltransferase [Pseudomonadota bacterium]